MSLITYALKQWGYSVGKGADSRGNGVVWITLRTARFRWEAELMQQVLIAHGISVRVLDLGVGFYMGQGSPAALQVHAEDQQTAILLLEPLDGE